MTAVCVGCGVGVSVCVTYKTGVLEALTIVKFVNIYLSLAEQSLSLPLCEQDVWDGGGSKKKREENDFFFLLNAFVLSSLRNPFNR